MDDATPLNFLAEMSNTEDAASKQSIKETALSLGISIPETLKAYYAREKNLRMYYEISPDNIVELDYVLPLKGGQLSLAHSLKSLPAIKGMMPFGLDALGNIFYADPKGAVHFYDHESGSMTKAGSL